MAFVRDPNGTIVEIPDDQVESASIVGYTPASAEDVAAEQARAAKSAEFQTLPQQLLGGAEALGRGASLNLTDPLAVALGADPERMAGRRKALGGFGTALEVAGAALPTVIGGPASAFARLGAAEQAALRAAGKAPGLVSEAASRLPTALLSDATEQLGARTATRLLGPQVAGELPGIARGALRGGVTELVEGLPYGVGQVITEDTLGDTDLTAEEALLTVGMGTLLGGGLGAAFGAAGGGLGRAVSLAQKHSDKALGWFESRYPEWVAGQIDVDPEDVRYAVQNMDRLGSATTSIDDLIAERRPAPVAPPEYVEAPVPPEAVFTPGTAPLETPGVPKPSPFDVPETVNIGGREVPHPGAGKRQEVRFAEEAATAIKDTRDAMEQLTKEFNGSFRAREFSTLLDGVVPEAKAEDEARRILGEMNGWIAEATRNGPDEITKAAIQQVKNIRDGLARRVFPELSDAATVRSGKAGVDQSGYVGSAESTVRTGANPRGEPVKYEVVEADTLVPSHDPKTWRPNRDYPEGVQERDYTGSQGEQLKVLQIQQQFDPALPLSNTVTAVDGPPIVTGGQRRFVLGGNGRTMGMQLAFESPDVLAAYRAELIRRASMFGVDPKQIVSMKKPVLVRTVEGLTDTSPASELTAAGRRYNESLTREMDSMARGVSDAKMLTPATIQDVAAFFDAAPDQTFGQILANRGKDLVQSLRRDKIITDQNAAEWLTPTGLTDAGKDRVRAMFLGRILGSPDRYARARSAGVLDKLERAVPYLAKVEAKNPALNEAAIVRRAVDMIDRVRNSESRESLETIRRSVGQLAGIASDTDDPLVAEVATLLSQSTESQVGKRFREWAKKASQPTDLVDRSLTREQSRRLLLGDAVSDMNGARLAAEIADPDAGKQAAFAAPVGAPGSVAAASAPKIPVKASDIFGAVDKAKNEMQELHKSIGQYGPLGKPTRSRVGNLAGNLKRSLENADVWGRAGSRQQAVNRALSELMDAEANALPLVAEKVTVKGQKKPEVSVDKLTKLLSDIDSPAKRQRLARVYNWLDKQRALRAEIQNTADAIGEEFDRASYDAAESRVRSVIADEQELNKIRGVAESQRRSKAKEAKAWAEAEAARKEYDAARMKAFRSSERARKRAAKDALESFSTKEAERKTAMKEATAEYKQAVKDRAAEIKAVGVKMRTHAKWGGIMDIAGATAVANQPLIAPVFVAYRFAKYLGSPDKTIRVLRHMKESSQKAKAALSSLAEEFVSGRRVRIARLVGAAAMPDAAVDMIANDPEAASDALSEGASEVRDFAPNVAQAMQGTLMRGGTYLASIKPRSTPGQYGTMLPPSGAAMAQYESVKVVVEDPKQAFALAGDGRLMPQQFAAVEQVWPKVAQQMREATLEALAIQLAEGRKPSYRVLQQASIIVGADLTATDDTLIANQAAMNEATPQESQPSVPKADKLTLSQRSQTPWEASEGN